jgi:thioredoxin reductase
MAEALSRFIVKRKDGVNVIDDLVIESDGLSIGRLIKNDLALNHPAVSRMHAGIKQIGNDFWIYNLSDSNGTLLNGELVERTPLAEGDLLQIGPFQLKINYSQNALVITIEREMELNPVAGQGSGFVSTPEISAEAIKTLIVQIPAKNAKPIVTPGGTQRLKMTGRLTGVLADVEERALKVFWDKRKREAGKLAEKTPLYPRGMQKIGKAQFNWRPTLDLRKLWRKSYWVWGIGIVALLALVSAFVYPTTYSPGQVSDAHSTSTNGNRGIALRPNANSCSECHNVVTGVQNKCIECHNTADNATVATSQNPKGFQPQTLIAGHQKANVTACNQCHTEHQGKPSASGLLNYGLCANCHNGKYTIEDGDHKGQKLPIPHGGGSVGLPQLGTDFKWTGWNAVRWQKALDRWDNKELQQAFTAQKLEKVAAVGYVKTDQFHYLHYLGKVTDDKACIVCHKDNKLDAKSAEGIKSLREACLKCHATTENTTGLKANLANCITCHKQHPNENQLATRADKATESGAQNLRDVNKFLASVENSFNTNKNDKESFVTFKGMGGASSIRQDKDLPQLSLDSNFGAVPWYGWVVAIFTFPTLTLVGLIIGTSRRKSLLKEKVEHLPADPNQMTPQKSAKEEADWQKLRASWLQSANIDIVQLKAAGPLHPYPLVNPVTCIGCHACVEACPHDVLAIVNGVSVPIAPDQCMEDTSCQVECPTNPKSCIVINTNKTIPPRKVPARDQRFKTNVEGIYLIGDVSGVPLIKNAINEGGAVVDNIVDDLQREGANASADYDVAIIGIGPAGLSAAVIAKQRGLRYVAIEQDKIVATIQQTYPAGKYVFYKPDTVDAKGGIPLPGVGGKKEEMLQGWFDAMMKNGVVINEEESCKSIKEENGLFTVACERGSLQEKVSYKVRKVIIAIGNRGTPLRLGVAGEDLKIMTQPPPILAKHCTKCGTVRREAQKFCNKCGEKFPIRNLPPVEDSKVKYRLTDPDEYVNKKCIVVGAGNSSIEAAVDLAGLKRDGDKITFTRNNEVTLVIRSDFKGDLKLGNKMNVYDCIDAGRIKVFFRTQIKDISEKEVVLMDGKGTEKARIANDYIFALIGGDRPTKFLESIGIKIG